MPDSPDSPVQMILFDVGRVLIQLNSWTASFPEDVFPREGLAEKVMRFTDSDEYFEYETGHVDSSTFLDRVRTYFGVEGSDEILSDYFCRQLGAPMPGMESLLDELSDAGFRLCGFSNTTEIHGERLPSYPTVAKLERLVTSYEVRARKPEVVSYDRTLETLAAEAGKTLFVDDREDNIVGAREAGMAGLVFTTTEQFREDLKRLELL